MSLVFTFPGGKLLTLTIPATAGNVVTTKSPGTSKRWVLLYGRIIYVADANAANRVIKQWLTDGTNTLTAFQRTDAITAGQTKIISYNPAVITDGGGLLSDDYIIPLGNPIIEGADQFVISPSAGLAGDAYSGFLRVLELGITP